MFFPFSWIFAPLSISYCNLSLEILSSKLRVLQSLLCIQDSASCQVTNTILCCRESQYMHKLILHFARYATHQRYHQELHYSFCCNITTRHKQLLRMQDEDSRPSLTLFWQNTHAPGRLLALIYLRTACFTCVEDLRILDPYTYTLWCIFHLSFGCYYIQCSRNVHM